MGVNPDSLYCSNCYRHPEDCGYDLFCEPGESASEYVIREEGTYDPVSGGFLCDECYVRCGMPTARGGWRATPENLDRLFAHD